MSNPALRRAIWQYVLRQGLRKDEQTTLVRVGDTVTWCDKSGHLVSAVIEEIASNRARIRVGKRSVCVGADEITAPRRAR